MKKEEFEALKKRVFLGKKLVEESEMNDSEVWCEHVSYTKDFGWVSAGVNAFKVNGWNFCPICGAPRPKTSLSLSAILLRAYMHPANSKKVDWGNVADAARAWMRELIESIPVNLYAPEWKNALLKALEER